MKRRATANEIKLYKSINNSHSDNFGYWKEIINKNCWLTPVGDEFYWHDLREVLAAINNCSKPFFTRKENGENEKLMVILKEKIKTTAQGEVSDSEAFQGQQTLF